MQGGFGQPQGSMPATLGGMPGQPMSGMPTQTGMAQQALMGGQQLQVRSQPEVFNSPFSPQQREQYLQSENLANYPPIPQVQQPYGGFGQQPGMGGMFSPQVQQQLAAMGFSSSQIPSILGALQQAPMGGNPALTQQMRAGAANMTPEQKAAITAQMRAGAANMTPEQRAAITAQMRAGPKAMPQPNNLTARPTFGYM